MTQILSKRSSTADKRPDPANLANGELAINFNNTSSNVFYKNSAGGLNVVGAATVSACAPNANPAGYSGNSLGEFWFDSTSSALKIWNGTGWFGISSGCSAGTVTSIVAGSGLTGGTISVSGTIALATSGVTPGSYTNASVTIDCFGRVTSASSGCSSIVCVTGTSPIAVDNTVPAEPVISVATASTTALGVTQLVDSISSTSTSCAATPAAVKCAYDLANAALPQSGGTLTGTLCTANISVGIGCAISIGGGSIIGISDNQNLSCSNIAASAKAVCMTNYELSNKLSCGGGTLTGLLSLCTAQGSGICFLGSGMPPLEGFSDSCLLANSNLGATSKAVACTYQFAFTMLPKTGGTMTGNITFNAGQVFPVSGIQNATSVDKGVVQIGTNISVASGVISVASGSTTVPGIVQLYDGVDSSSTALALTANQGKNLQDQIDALSASTNLTLAGTIDGSTGLLESVTAAGAAKSFVIGQVLPTSTNNNQDYFVIVTVPGTMTPPGGSAQLTHQGDWWVSGGNGTGWVFLDVGFNADYATTTTAGIVRLSTDALAQAGADSTTAVTPSALQSKVTDCYNVNSSTCLASAAAVFGVYNLALSANGTANNALPKSTYQTKGSLIVGNGGDGTYSVLPVGANDYVLTADSACTSGLKWVPNTGGVSSLTVCPTLCNLGTASAPILCAIPASAPVGSTPGNYGVVQLDCTVNSVSFCTAATSSAVKCAYDVAADGLSKSNGGTVYGNIIMRSTGNITPSCIGFCSYLGTSYLNGISDDTSLSCSSVAASATALCLTAMTADAALPRSGGTMSGAITLCDNSQLTGVTQYCTGISLPFSCCTTAFSAFGACCLYNFITTTRFPCTGGTMCGPLNMEIGSNIRFLNSGGGSGKICFDSGATGNCAIAGICSSISSNACDVAASSSAVKCAYDVGAAAIPCSAFAAKGNVLAGTASGTYSALAVGTDGQVLIACAACASGLTWGAGGGGSGTVTSVTAGTGLTGGTITTSGTIALDTTCVVQPTAYTAKGTILSASAASTPSALAVGANGCTLVANSACTTGLCWGPGAIPCSTVTAKGDLIAGTAANTFSALPVGADGLFLTANSSSATGLCWTQVGDSPVGAIAFFAMNTAPTGWLVADGSCVSRTTYAGLFAKVGTTYGAGNGTTTFQLPDLRGRFARGWNSTATGCDPSRVFGSCQSQAFACHSHGITMCPGSAGVPEWAIKDDTSLIRGYATCGGSATPVNRQRGFSDCVGGSATETRPDNIALLPCIKVGISVALDVNATPTVAGAMAGCTSNLCHNTMLGCSAGAGVSATTCAMTAVGKHTLTVATGNNNTAIGTYAGCTLTTGANNTLIGFNAAPSSVTANNEITFGNSSITTLRAQVTTITGLSDARDKKYIRDIPIGLDFINEIRPVEFEWNMRDGGKVGEIDTGFIAQDLQEVQEDIGYTLPGLVYEANPDRLEAGYGKLLPVLVKAIQELSEKNKELEQRIKQLEG